MRTILNSLFNAVRIALASLYNAVRMIASGSNKDHGPERGGIQGADLRNGVVAEKSGEKPVKEFGSSLSGSEEMDSTDVESANLEFDSEEAQGSNNANKKHEATESLPERVDQLKSEGIEDDDFDMPEKEISEELSISMEKNYGGSSSAINEDEVEGGSGIKRQENRSEESEANEDVKQVISGANVVSKADQLALTELGRVKQVLGQVKKQGPRSIPMIVPEDICEYEVEESSLAPISDEYLCWNRAIAEHLLLNQSSGHEVFLAVTPRILAHIWLESGAGSLTPEDAEAHFADAVSRIYRARVLANDAGLRVLRRCGDNEIPDCIGFLSLSVLAAYRMQSDEEAAGHAYYIRLAKLLNCDLSGTYPIGFNPTVFESLWLFLRSWLKKENGAHLIAPGREEAGFRHYVALPLAHVPLRCVDIEKLPNFFVWAGYQPGSRVSAERLSSELQSWNQSQSVFTPTGAAALNDNRRSAVMAQVEGELESWDGSTVESKGCNSATVEIMLDWVLRRPNLFYLPRCPTTFPKLFQSGERVFEATDEGWYDPLPIGPEDGMLISDGFEWKTTVNGMQLVLRRSGALVIPFSPSEYSNFHSRRGLLLGVPCAVLCQEHLTETVERYLAEISHEPCRPISDPQLPSGWRLFNNVIAKRRMDPPFGLEALKVDSNVELVVSGGLRIGRRWAWIAGAPPQITAAGLEPNTSVTLDGTPVQTSKEGVLQVSGGLSQPGVHFVEAGGVRRRIEVVKPEFSARTPVGSRDMWIHEGVAVALPQGSWVLIGPIPGEIARTEYQYFGGSMGKCLFKPIWAVEVNAGPGAKVAALGTAGPQDVPVLVKLGNQKRLLIESWVQMIYNAHIRRPNFVRIDDSISETEMAETWRKYVAKAKQIKRALKKRGCNGLRPSA